LDTQDAECSGGLTCGLRRMLTPLLTGLAELTSLAMLVAWSSEGCKRLAGATHHRQQGSLLLVAKVA
ncbi:MAG: hypothetical protein CTR54_11840, partial [Rhizobium sp.]